MDEITKFNQYADEWWDFEGPLQTLHDINPVRVAFIQAYAPTNGKNILDLGCGGGILTEALARTGGHVTGIDLAETAIHTAKEHARSEELTIDYQCIDIADLRAKPFDIITCLEMLEHVPSPELIIQAATQHLTAGGRIFFSTINRNMKAYLQVVLAAEYILQIIPKQTHDYKKFIKPSELEHYCQAAGLTRIALSGIHYNPFSQAAKINQDVSVNYIACYQK